MSTQRIEERTVAPDDRRKGATEVGRHITMADAMKEALDASMTADESVFVLVRTSVAWAESLGRPADCMSGSDRSV